MAEAGVDVCLYREHIFHPPTLTRGKQVANLAETIRRSEISIYRIGKLLRKGVLVGSNDHAAGWIEYARKLVEGDEAVPLEVAGSPVDGHIAAISGSFRQLADGVVTDVAVDVRINEVRTWSGQPGNGGGELLPVFF